MPTTFKTQSRAKALRHNPTDAEQRLWNALRNHSLGGHKFLRQVPIEPYIVDFLCRKKRLIVEADGATHAEDHEIAHDARRDAFLRERGYRIFRVTNVDVFRNLDEVLRGILLELEAPHPPLRGTLSRQAGEG